MKVGDGGKKKRGDQNATVPGRRTRKQIGVEKRVVPEAVGRVKRIPGRLEMLKPQAVAEMLVDDVLSGELKDIRFLLRLTGRYVEGDAKGLSVRWQ